DSSRLISSRNSCCLNPGFNLFIPYRHRFYHTFIVFRLNTSRCHPRLRQFFIHQTVV
ncbi:hypothetical protein Leryth_000309, partial [Lithospermum erythrorhizon]